MSKKDKLLEKAKKSPRNITIKELCYLVKHAGFERRKNSSGHKIFKHPKIKVMMNIQPDKSDKSKAKEYQIKQLLEFIEDFKLMED